MNYMDSELALRCMKQKFGTARRMAQMLGMDENPDELMDPDDPDQLAWVQSKLSNDDFLQFVRIKIAEARRGASDRRAADAERVGNLETGSLHEGLTESAQAHDAAIHSAIPTAAELHNTTHEPGIA